MRHRMKKQAAGTALHTKFMVPCRESSSCFLHFFVQANFAIFLLENIQLDAQERHD